MLWAIILSLTTLFFAMAVAAGLRDPKNDSAKDGVLVAACILLAVTSIISGVFWESVGASYPSHQDNEISGMNKKNTYAVIYQFNHDLEDYVVAIDLSDSSIRTFRVDKSLPHDTKFFRYLGKNKELEVVPVFPLENQ